MKKYLINLIKYLINPKNFLIIKTKDFKNSNINDLDGETGILYKSLQRYSKKHNKKVTDYKYYKLDWNSEIIKDIMNSKIPLPYFVKIKEKK